MKKVFLLAALAIAALASCTKEVAVDEVIKVDVVPEGYVPITLNAQFDAATKASLSGNMVIWDVDEELAVFADGAGQPIKFTVTESFTVGSIAGVTIAGNVPATAKSFVAVYPWQEGLSCKDGVVSLSIPEEQVIPEGAVIDPKALPSVAYFADAESYGAFRNVMALVKFNVGQTEGVEEVKIALGGEGYTAGKVNVTYSTDDAVEPVIENACDAYSTVVAEGGFAPETDYWVAVGPVKATGLVAVARVGNRAYTRESKNEVVLERNKGIDLKDITLEASNLIVGISNAEELAAFLAEDGAATYPSYWEVKLLNDIDCYGVELPLAASYTGTFDGQGYKIMNWTTATPLFTAIKGELKNLVIDKTCVYNPPTNGRIGWIAGGVSKNGSIIDCTVNASIVFDGVTLTGSTKCGMFAGYSAGKIKGCVNNGNMTLKFVTNAKNKDNFFGGIVGSYNATEAADKVAIEGCVNNGDIVFEWSDTPRYSYIGGIVGCTDTVNAPGAKEPTDWADQGSVKGCVNNGDLSYKMDAPATGAYNNMGGVAGYIEGSIESCTNKGDVHSLSEETTANATRPAVGGVAGWVLNSVKDCVNEGEVILTGTFAAGTTKAAGAGGSRQPTIGGVVASVGRDAVSTTAELSGCINKGNVSITTLQKPESNAATQTYIGGVAGYCAVPVNDCHNTGSINDQSGSKTCMVGGVVGNTIADVSNCDNSGEILRNGRELWTSDKPFGAQSYVGGVVGFTNAKVELSNLINTGSVKATKLLNSAVLNYVGGVLGSYNTSLSVLKNCKNSGDISSDAAACMVVGGVAGAFNGEVNGCENIGSVSVINAVSPEGKETEVGGLIGYAYAQTLKSCVNTGNVSCDCEGSFAGGLVGGNNSDKDGASLWSGSKINCTVSGQATKGAILGRFRYNTSAADKYNHHTITAGEDGAPVEVDGAVAELPLVGEINGKHVFRRMNVIVNGTKVGPEVHAERILGLVPTGANQPWTTAYESSAAFLKGNDRSAATDGEYAFVVGASVENPGILAIDLKDPTKVKTLDITNFEGGFLKVASLNTIYNPETEKYILLACSLSEWNEAGDGYQLNIYAFKDGIDQPATRILNFADSQGRHLGEIFSVVGDWHSGEIWVRNRFTPSTLCWPINDGVLGSPIGGSIGYDGSKGLGVVYKYGMGSNQVLLENENLGIRYNLTVSSWIESFAGVLWAGKDQSVMGRKYGVTPFEIGGNKFIAYTQVGKYTNIKNGARARLKVIEDQGSAELFGPSIEADNIKFEYPIQNLNDKAATEADFDAVLYAEEGPSFIPDERVLAACSVAKTDDAVYVLSHCYNVGLSVFKFDLR